MERVAELRTRVLDGALRRLARRIGEATLRPRRPAARRGGWSSTTCSCSPATCCAALSTARPCGRRCSGGTAGCCSTSSRTPTRSRSSWPSGSPAARRPTPPSGTTSTCRPAACSSSATRSSRSTGSGAPTSRMYLRAQQHIGEPVVLDTNFRTGAPVLALDQPRVRPAHHRRGPARSRLPSAGRLPPRRAQSARRSCCSASTCTPTSPTPPSYALARPPTWSPPSAPRSPSGGRSTRSTPA